MSDYQLEAQEEMWDAIASQDAERRTDDCPRCGASPMEDQRGDPADWCECDKDA